MKRPCTGVLVLCLYPFCRGYAFVLFESPATPCDWGVKEIKEKNRNEKTLRSIKCLIEKYHPEVIVIEDVGEGQHRRTPRIRRLYRRLGDYASSEYIDLHCISMNMVRRYFAEQGAKTKYDMARLICREVKAIAHRLPRIRKAWMGTEPRQSLFDAAALGLIFYKIRGVPSPYDGVEG